MSINVTVSGTAVGVAVSSGIGPAGFIVAPGTATNAFGTFQLTAGNGITITTTVGQFQIASYSTTQAASFAPVQSVAGRVGTVVLQAADITAGTFVHARIPTISYTALANVPTTFAPSAHTHSTTDVVSFTAAASAAAPVQSVQGRSGAVVLTRADITAAEAVHTHSTADIVAFTASASAAAPVQSVAGRTGAITLSAADVSGLAVVATSGSYTSLSNVPLTFAPAAHTHSTTEVAGLTASFAAAVHTHDAADVQSGVFSISRIPTISFTALSNTAHSHSTTDITGYSALPAQSGNANRVLSTDGTAATWATRYSVVDPVLVQGDGMVLTRDTSAGSITVAFAGGTSGIVVSSATPQPLGVAAAGSSPDAARADHVHKLPTVGDITAAAAVHTHAAGDIQSGVLDVARIPTISFTALSNTAHSHATTDITGYTLTSLNGLSGAVTLAAGSNVTVSTAGSTITIAATGGGGGGGGASPAARSLHFVFRG